MRFAFISRHTPTSGQVKLAADQGITLVTIGDRDAFSVMSPTLWATKADHLKVLLLFIQPLLCGCVVAF